MDLLKKGIELKKVSKTGNSKKLVIDGDSKNYEIYKINLDLLYFNDKNDRIATWINEYKIKNDIIEFDKSYDDFDNIIHEFVKDSNPNALNKTQKNIELVGQQECGVVLRDGRVIDGNRRFACLRNIQEKRGVTQYFEAIILDHKIDLNEKEIKMLELNIQHGKDEKIDYDPIEKLVGIYNTIIEKKILTEKEYAKSIDMTDKEIRTEVSRAELLADFLEFINAPKHFYIAKQWVLNDPLRELQRMLNKINEEEAKENFKNVFYLNIFLYKGDTIRHVRKMEKIAKNPNFLDDFIKESGEPLEKLNNEISKSEILQEEEINRIKSNQELRESVEKITEKYAAKCDNVEIRNLPLKNASKALDTLKEIDLNVVKKIGDDSKPFYKKIKEIDDFIKKMKDDFGIQ